MGFGLGAAIGTQIANPDKRVALVTGDGSFRMNMNELLTVTKYQLPIVVVILNNGVLGMVRQWQALFNQKRYSDRTLLRHRVDRRRRFHKTCRSLLYRRQNCQYNKRFRKGDEGCI